MAHQPRQLPQLRFLLNTAVYQPILLYLTEREQRCRRPNSGPERPSALGEEESGMKTYRLVTCIALLAGLAGCAQEMQKTGKLGIKPFEVKLEVTKDAEGKDVLAIKNDRTEDCEKFPNEDRYRKGCIVAGVNEMVNVDIKLSGTGGWYFTAFQVCSVEEPQKPATFPDCSLTREQRADWLVLAKSAIGVLDEKGRFNIPKFETGLKQFKVLDLNLMEGNYFRLPRPVRPATPSNASGRIRAGKTTAGGATTEPCQRAFCRAMMHGLRPAPVDLD
jgi:hypothetical protein